MAGELGLPQPKKAIQSLSPAGLTPAFGRVIGLFRPVFMA
ncbi:hypothetical protein AciX8_1199 [Granulicella mallensis MP5ACTX8]|uniref:Uncharacterized protein n=1 Tax=Granulicella mallensis (strain ATCC BAA-1857 / DSM 23137 / MP5ACTX8) TaxID=682795 RepID=G8NX15_GRAMM|nr:hypothetical protein AciX8_1199 [Granulicella mallensis MP5ACTX8]